MVTIGNGETITLQGVDAASLTASDFVFDQTPVTNNPGTMSIGDGAILPLSGIINNTGTIALNSTGDETDLELIQNGITLQGGGQLVLSDNAQNVIFGSSPDVTLTNVDNTISGAGQLGEGQLTLANEGTIDATGTNALVLDTGSNVISNSGTLEATGAGGLIVNSAVANSGSLLADGGNLTFNGAVTGNGSATISGAASLEFAGASAENVNFAAGSTGTLKLDDTAEFTGSVSGSDDDHLYRPGGPFLGAGANGRLVLGGYLRRQADDQRRHKQRHHQSCRGLHPVGLDAVARIATATPLSWIHP